jgi:hypothetical protein
MPDPVIVAAIITAAFKAAPTILDKFSRGAGDQDAKVKKVVSENYDKLKNLVTPACVKLLRFGEDGSYHDVSQYRMHLYPEITFNDHVETNRFDHEFEYRLRYLVATGFFTNAMGEYYITRLGAAFLAKARDEKDFRDELR